MLKTTTIIVSQHTPECKMRIKFLFTPKDNAWYNQVTSKTTKRKEVCIMKFKEFLKNLCLNVKEGVSRFFTAFICTVLTFLTASYAIIFEPDSYEIIIPLCMAFALVTVLSVLLKTIQEYISDKLLPVYQYILCAVVAILSFFLIKENLESLYMVMAYGGVLVSFICFIFFVLMRGENRDTNFPKLIASWVFSNAICTVLSYGLTICIFAFQTLIFNWDDIYKVIIIVNMFIWLIGFVNLFLSHIPKKDAEIPQSKIFRILVLFVGLPVYALLLLILLVYLAKIVVTWNLPVGEINWFASFASLFFIFFLLSVMQYKEKIAKFFTKFGGYFLAPVLIMQAIAVFKRIDAYGLTTPRISSLVLILISILFIAGSIVIPKHLNKIALASGVIALIVTVTPFNIIDMPIKSQTKILETVLTENNMLVDGKVIPKADVSEDDARKILSAYKYLKYDADNTPDFIPDSEMSAEEIFGFKDPDDYRSYDSGYKYYYFYAKDSIDITDYDTIIKIDDRYSKVAKFEHNGQTREIDLTDFAKELISQKESGAKLDLYVVDEKTALYFSRLTVDTKYDDVSYISFDGFVLIKE